jgi:Mg2+-importing ATPase
LSEDWEEPADHVADRVSQPQRWNIKHIQRFVVVLGLISSVFDLMTSYQLGAVKF